MPSSPANRRMLRDPGPSCSKRSWAAATIWATRGDRGAPGAGRPTSPGSRGPSATGVIGPTPGARAGRPPFLPTGAVAISDARVGEEEHRMLGGDPAEVVLARVGGHAVEEHPDLHLPLAQVGAQDGRLLGVGQLRGDCLFPPAPDEQGEATAVRRRTAG